MVLLCFRVRTFRRLDRSGYQPATTNTPEAGGAPRAQPAVRGQQARGAPAAAVWERDTRKDAARTHAVVTGRPRARRAMQGPGPQRVCIENAGMRCRTLEAWS